MLILPQSKQSSPKSRRPSQRRHRKLRVETLEARRVLATILWDGGAGTQSWHDADNWVGDVLPTASDDVVIDLPEAGTINVNTDVDILSLDSQTASISLQGGAFSVGAISTIVQALRLSGGSLAGDGDVVAGNLDWINGTMSGSGRTIVEQTGVIRSTSSNQDKHLIRELENRGSLSIDTGLWFGQNDSGAVGRLLNPAGATLVVSQASVTTQENLAHEIINDGVIVYAGNTSTVFNIATSLVNRGTIRVESGTLRLAQNPWSSNTLTNSGTIELTGGSLVLTVPQSDFNTGTTVTSGGTLVAIGSLSVNQAMTLPRIQLHGTLNGPGDVTISEHLDWINGTMSGSGKTIVEQTAVIRTTGGVQNKHLIRELENHGSFSINTGFNLGLNGSGAVGRLLNLAGATLTVDGASVGTQEDLAHEIINDGLLVFAGTSTNVRISSSVDNRGTIRVDSGTLRLDPNPWRSNMFTNSGAIELTGGGLVLSIPQSDFNTGTTVTGDRTMTVTGILSVNETMILPRLQLHGTLNGPGDLIVSRHLDWINGTMSGSGQTIVEESGIIRTTGGSQNKHLIRELENRGSLSINTGFTLGLNFSGAIGRLLNSAGATLTVSGARIGTQDDQTHEIVNDGLLVYAGTSGNDHIGSTLVVNRGAIRVDSGNLRVEGGTFTNNGTIDLTGGGLILSVPLSVFETGAVVVGDGLIQVLRTLTVNGTAFFRNLQIFGGELNGPGDAIVRGNLDWISGTMSGSGKTIIEGTSQVRGSDFNQQKNLWRSLENQGTTSIETNSLFLGGSSGRVGTIVNARDATLTLDALIREDGGAVLPYGIVNDGLLVYTGNNSWSIDTRMQNKGTLRVESGRLLLNRTLVNSGSIELMGGNLQLAQRTIFEPGTNVAGENKLAVRNDLHMGSDVIVPNLELNSSSALISGSGDLTVSGQMDWIHGKMTGEGTTIIEGSMHVSSPSGSSFRDLARTLENRGRTTITSSDLRLGIPGGPVDAAFFNREGATLLLQSSAIERSVSGGEHLFENEGIIQGSGESEVDLVNRGLVLVDGAQLTVADVVNEETGRIELAQGDLTIDGDLTLNENSGFTARPTATAELKGALLGSSVAESLHQVDGMLRFSNPNPTVWEAMSQDLGATVDGFDSNFSFGTVSVQEGAASGATVIHVQDSSDNAPGESPEAIYVDALEVGASTTLDLNGFNLYVRQLDLQGTILGDYSIIGDSGPLVFNSNNPGSVFQAGEVDEWTFFGRAGSSVTLIADPGSSSSLSVVPEYLGGVQVTLIAPDGTEVIAAESAVVGETLTLSGVELPQQGTYRVQIRANGLAASGTGNYGVAIYDATVDDDSLVYNQREIGLLESPYSVDRWSFVGQNDDQVRLDLIANQVQGLRFDLTGPDGWVGFTEQIGDSSLITLPSAGTYTIEAQSLGVDDGSFSFQIEKTNVVDLTLGSPLETTLTGTGAAQLYRFDLPADGPISIDLQDGNASNRNEIYLRFGSPPNRRTFDFRANDTTAGLTLDVPFARSGQWYALVYGQDTANDSPITLSVDAIDNRVDTVSPAAGLPQNATVLTIDGLGFLPGMSVALVDSAGTATTASEVNVAATDRLIARFDLVGLSAGDYDLQVNFPDANAVQLDDAFELLLPGDADFQADLIADRAVGAFATAEMFVEYSNRGDVPMKAPVLTVEPFDPVNGYQPKLALDIDVLRSRFWSTTLQPGLDASIQIYAQGETPGWLMPGEQIRVPFYYAGTGPQRGLDDRLVLRVRDASDTDPVDWTDYLSGAQPSTLSDEAWQAVIGNLQTIFGTTWDAYISTLSENAIYLSSIGRDARNLDELFQFIYRQADGLGVAPVLASAIDAAVPVPGIGLSYGRTFGNTISQRHTVGPYGRGWQAPGQESLTVDADGVVRVIESSGGVRRFEPDRRYGNRFVADASETATLRRESDGRYRLTESGGAARMFAADGKLQWVQDVNANRLTYAYTGDNLTSLTHSTGESISLTYNADNLIESITDSAGWTTTFTYDPTDLLLLSATNPAGTISYGYVTEQGTASEYALESITDASGVSRFFEYDALGRLSASYVGGEEGRVEYTYDQPGRVTIQDESGAASSLYYDHQGRVVRSEDSSGNYLLFDYDSASNLIHTTDTFGASEKFTWSRDRQLLSIQDRLGGELRFAPGGPNNLPLSFTDSRGNSIRYQYDAAGNLIGRIFADGSVERFGYDGEGSVTGTTNRRNQEIIRTVNDLGQLTMETYPDGSTVAYTYDTRNRLESVNDRGKVTTYAYDAAERLTRIDYPASRWIEYGYDAAGRQTRLEDHTGHVVQYAYDTVGRLSQLLDAADVPIVTYGYDDASRLISETHANGTVTTYTYDAIGRIQTVLNEQADGTDNSRFDYAYDAIGNRTGMTTLDGEWTYDYDLTGQLVHAVFDSTNAEIPDQDLLYEYDSAGNRTRTVRNSVETIYTTNSLNQIASAGDTTYDYDLDGNLIRSESSDGVATYTYDVENRLTRVFSPNGVWEYEYDAFGNRIASVVNGERTEYLIDPSGLGNVIGVYDEAGQRSRSLAHGLGLESLRVGSDTYFLDYDAIGSTTGMTTAEGAYVNAYTYGPFGNLIESLEAISNDYQFVGRLGVSNEDNGLSFMRARFYSPETGSFTQQDPIRLGGGDPNLYRYALNAPTSIIDPTGLQGQAIHPCGEDEPVDVTGPYLTSPCDSGSSHSNPPAGSDPNLGAGPNTPSGGIPCTEESEPVDVTATYLTAQSSQTPCSPNQPDVQGNDTGGVTVDTADPPEPRPADPNEKVALVGYRPQGFIASETRIPYRVKFENLGPGSDPTPARPATAPAQRVVVTDQLSDDLDWSTVQFTQFGFGEFVIVLDEPTTYHYELLPVEIEDKSFDVEIEFSFDASNGMLRATFTSLDRELGLPPDVLTGFLPPEDGTGIGQGYFDFVAQTVSGLPTGTEIRNIAEIRFDGQEIIATNQIDPLDPSKGTSPDLEALVTIDADAPESAIAPAATTTGGGEILLVWSGQDGAGESGIRDFTIYVSEGGAEPVVWLDRTMDTQATFDIELDKTYSFYSVASDNAGNVESEPAVFDLNVVGGPAPKVEDVILNGGSQQRSFVTQATVVFDRVVQIDTATNTPLELQNTDTGESVRLQQSVRVSNNKTHVDLAFLPGPSVGTGGTLLDGNYQLRIIAEHIVGSGLVMDGDGDGVGGDDFVFGTEAADRFFRFFGDSDGDRDVDGQDYGRFGLSFLKTAEQSGYDPIFDFDDDGDVDGQDYGQFGLNFLRQI